MDNAQIAQVFDDIAGLLELKGESAFLSRAYRQGAATLRDLPDPVAGMVRSGFDLQALPGVGKAISDKTRELVETGRLDYYERLKSEFPDGIVGLLRVHGLGPATVRRLWKELGVTTTAALEEAVADGRLASLPRLGPRTAERLRQQLRNLSSPQHPPPPSFPPPTRHSAPIRHSGESRNPSPPSA